MDYILETDRLRFREMQIEDASEMFSLNLDPEVTKYTDDKPFESIQATSQFLKQYQDVYKNFGYGRWIVELKLTGEILGWAGLKYFPKTKITDVGYRFFKKYWGYGYATEAAKACIDYGFGNLKLNSIIAHARKDNVASVRVLEKCGMKIIGEGKECGGEIFIFEILQGK